MLLFRRIRPDPGVFSLFLSYRTHRRIVATARGRTKRSFYNVTIVNDICVGASYGILLLLMILSVNSRYFRLVDSTIVFRGGVPIELHEIVIRVIGVLCDRNTFLFSFCTIDVHTIMILTHRCYGVSYVGSLLRGCDIEHWWTLRRGCVVPGFASTATPARGPLCQADSV